MTPTAPGPRAADGPLAGLDPGRSKCGLVLTDPARLTISEALVLPPEAAWERLQHWRRQRGLAVVVIGDGTGSGPWRRRLASLLTVKVVDERGTTLAARHRYWQLFPPGAGGGCCRRGCASLRGTGTTWWPSCCWSGGWGGSCPAAGLRTRPAR